MLIFFTLIAAVPVLAVNDTFVVDNKDPSINYSAHQWTPISGSNQVANGVQLTRQAGATASYSFVGTGISVFGTQGTPGGNTTLSTYSIDGSTPSQYTVPSDLEDIQYQVQFYASPTLSNGQHTLLITNLNDKAWYWLDFLKVTTPISSSAPLNPSQSTFGTATNSVAISAATPTSTPRPSSHAKAISTGSAIGIGVGSTALLVLLVMSALWWRRHVRQVRPARKPKIGILGERDLEEKFDGGVDPYPIEYFSHATVPLRGSRGVNEKTLASSRRSRIPYPTTATRITHESDSAPTLKSSHGMILAQSQTYPEGSDSHYTSSSLAVESNTRPSRAKRAHGPDSSPERLSESQTRTSQLHRLDPPFFSQSPQPISGAASRQSMDGGIRIAGGPPEVEVQIEQEEVPGAATLPPAYRIYQ